MVTVDHLLLHFYKQAMDGFEGGWGWPFSPVFFLQTGRRQRGNLSSPHLQYLLSPTTWCSRWTKFCLGLFLGPACLSTGVRTRRGKSRGNLQLLAANRFWISSSSHCFQVWAQKFVSLSPGTVEMPGTGCRLEVQMTMAWWSLPQGGGMEGSVTASSWARSLKRAM